MNRETEGQPQSLPPLGYQDVGWTLDEAQTPEGAEAMETPEGLEPYPRVTESVRHLTEELDEYLTEIRQVAISEAPAGYDVYSSCHELVAANPSIAIPLFLKRRGAPIEIIQTVEHAEPGSREQTRDKHLVEVAVSPEILKAYNKLWHSVFEANPRRLANDIARGMTERVDAIPELAKPSIMEIPSGNRYMLWAYEQGIIQRAYVTSTLVKYLARGADDHVLGSAEYDLPLVEQLIAEHGVLPLSLETVLGMSEATVGAALQLEPELITELRLTTNDLPEVDAESLKLPDSGDARAAIFEAYWKPVKDKLEAEKAWKAERDASRAQEQEDLS